MPEERELVSSPRFLVLDGVEGCGKSTQVRLLGKYLSQRGIPFRLTCEPGGTPVGARLRQLLLHEELERTALTETFLFCADRAEHLHQVIVPALNQGLWVVSDRFSASTFAYQVWAGELEAEIFFKLDEAARSRVKDTCRAGACTPPSDSGAAQVRALQPDLTIILDLDPAAGRARKALAGGEPGDTIERRPEHYHARVREGFLKYAERLGPSAAVLNADQPVEDLHQEILHAAGVEGLMPFAGLVGHEAAIRSLQRALAEQRLPTAYLLVGPPHIGKTSLAVAFAQAANCERPAPYPLSLRGGAAWGADRRSAGQAVVPDRTPSGPPPAEDGTAGPSNTLDPDLLDACGVCATCLKIARETYPDTRLIRPRRRVEVKGEETDEKTEVQAEFDDALIDVKLIERLRMDAAASAFEARRRVYIITQAEAMNAEAANRFLKTLEEPPGDLTFILTASQPSRLLPTIISRCQTLTLHPLHRTELRQALGERFPETPAERLDQIAGLSGGALGRALSLMEKPEILALRGELLDLLAALPSLQPWETLRHGERLLDLMERWWLADQSEIGRDFLKQAHDAAVRAELREALAIMHSWFRDLLALQRPELLTNPDYQEQLQEMARRYPPEAALEACRVLEGLRQDLGQNPNLRLAAEALFIRLLHLRNRL